MFLRFLLKGSEIDFLLLSKRAASSSEIADWLALFEIFHLSSPFFIISIRFRPQRSWWSPTCCEAFDL